MSFSIFKQDSETWLRFILRLLLAALFIFSGLTKLYPIEYFELTFVSSGFGDWGSAPWQARIIIALELSLGVALIFNTLLRRLVFPAVNLLLAFFIVYLIYVSFLPRPEANCGCFGSLLPMTPVQAVLKNAVLLALGLWLRSRLVRAEEIKSLGWLQFCWFPLALITLLVLMPVTTEQLVTAEKQEEPVTQLRELESLLPPARVGWLEKGSRLVGIFNPDCGHCVVMAKKIALVERETELPPMHVIFTGDSSSVEGFLEETGLHCTHNMISTKQYLAFGKLRTPSLLQLESGVVKKYWTSDNFSPETFRAEFPETRQIHH